MAPESPLMAPRSVALSTDYLVVGGGAMALAFMDELLTGTADKTVVMCDTRARPGGHWNDAYDFVRLHQPAAYYGVNSEVLGSGGSDLASKSQILAYFELVVKKWEATGRLSFYPQCRYTGEDSFSSLVDPSLQYLVTVREKTVEANYLTTRVPSTHPPRYTVHPDVSLVPINGLARLDGTWQRYVVIGAGKTGIDAVLHLLDSGLPADNITWVVPNDSWLTNRDYLQIANLSAGAYAMFGSVIEAKNPHDCYRRMESAGYMMRLSPSVWPTKYKCATVSVAELEKLRTVHNVLRQGRVSAIHPEYLEFEAGSRVPMEASTCLYVDCSSDGLATTPVVPIWQNKKIVLQPVSMCQQVASAATIAALELEPGEDEKKNLILQPVPHPNFPRDLFIGQLATMANDERMASQGAGFFWQRRSRLLFTHHLPLWHLTKMVWFITQTRATFLPKMQQFAEGREDSGREEEEEK